MIHFTIAVEFERADKKYPTSTYTAYHEVYAENRADAELIISAQSWLESFVFLNYVYELRDIRIDEDDYMPSENTARAQTSRPGTALLRRWQPAGEDEHGT